MTNFTPLSQAIMALLAALVTGYLLPYLRQRITREQQERVARWVRVAVAAAEQLYREPGMGEAKLAYVRAFLRRMGIAVDDALEAQVEAAVYSLDDRGGEG